MKTCSERLQLKNFSAALIDGLKAELYLTPKPGLVDLANSGSHNDLSLVLMSRSIALMRDYLDELCVALAGPYGYTDLVAIGQAAEQRMYRELGTNCHRGGIFLCGLLLVSSVHADLANPVSLRQAVKRCAAGFFALKEAENSHGEQVRKRYTKAGIVHEALQGLPAVFEDVLPSVLDSEGDMYRGMYLAMAKLMQRVDDSTSLHRCGEMGLALLRRSGKHLESCIVAGDDPVPLLNRMDREFRSRNLTMGGVADLLGVGLGYAGYLLRRGKASAGSVVLPLPSDFSINGRQHESGELLKGYCNESGK